MDLKPPPLYLLTGPIGAGKTIFCRQLVQAARLRGWRVAGLLSPAVMQDGQKTGIFLEDLNSGEQRLLAIDPLTPHANFVRASSPFGRGESVHTFPVGKWLFDPQVLRWGNAVLASCPPCDLLIVDELGPLEFNAGQGLTAAFDLLTAGQFRVGLMVIRPTLLEAARARWPWAEVLPVAEAAILNFL